MGNCQHKGGKTNHVRDNGDEIVTWTTCNDCNAIVASSRRAKYLRPKR